MSVVSDTIETQIKSHKKGKLMARSLSVKIPTSALIADIEKSIAKIDVDVAAYAEIRKQYEADLKKYNDDIIAFAIKALQDKDNIGTEHNSLIRVSRSYSGNVSVDFDVEGLGFPKKPEEPQKPNEKTYFGREYISRKELLERNLRVLKMTTQEEVSASSYSAVIDLI
jgi:hypothetical protein